MTKMRAVDAAVKILELEGATQTFGLPGAAINPFYDAMRKTRRDPARPGPARGRRLAHGRRVHPGQGRQHRGLHRHLRAGRHRHDHRPVRRVGRLGADPVHHRPGAGGPAAQGGLPGRRHRGDRAAGDEVGRHHPRARPGAGCVPAGVPPDEVRPARAGADRPAVRRADGRDRLRPRHLHPAAGLRTGRQPGPDRQGPRHALRRRTAAARRRRRHHQRRRRRPARRAGGGAQRPGDPHPDGVGRHP